MFDVTRVDVVNRDLEIASKKRYEDKINWLESDLRQSCTPEQLEKAESIADEFRKRIVFKYISAENSIFNCVVWQDSMKPHSLIISFTLNGQDKTIEVKDVQTIIKCNKHSLSVIDKIKQAILEAIAKELCSGIVLRDMIDSLLKKG